MKKLLFQFDTDPLPSVFDTVVAYDGGADHVIPYPDCVPERIQSLVEGTIFTRSAANKKYTAIFIGGSDINTGDALMDAVRRHFFGNFRVSVMNDCNGCNTTAAAAVASVLRSGDVRDKQALILAGTGPVGSRAAVMLAREGARVSITSRSLDKSTLTSTYLADRFKVDIRPLGAAEPEERAALAQDADIIIATGAAGVELLAEKDWAQLPDGRILVDANAVPPAGISGIEMNDRGQERHGKTVWGSLGFGAMKLSLQRRCIARLFEQNDLVLDADEIFNMAKQMG